jgi:hypothetical protein
MGQPFAPFRLRLRDAQNPPREVIDQLREKLPGVVITVESENEQVTFVARDEDVEPRVRAALDDVCGAYEGLDSPGWTRYFLEMPDGSG